MTSLLKGTRFETLPARHQQLAFRDWMTDPGSETLSPEIRHVFACAPTGFGKTLGYILAADALGPDSRVMILTGTKALQDQIYQDFKGSGVVQLQKGKSNYRCDENPKIDAGTAGVQGDCGGCPRKKFGGCAYYDQRRRTAKGRIVLGNYSFALSVAKFESEPAFDPGDFDLVVCDEAHEVEGQLISAHGAEFQRWEWHSEFGGVGGKTRVGPVPALPGQRVDDPEVWTAWAQEAQGPVLDRVVELEKLAKAMGAQAGARLGVVNRILQVVGAAATLGDNLGVNPAAGMKGEGVVVEPLKVERGMLRLLEGYCRPAAESRAAGRVLYTSATISQETVRRLQLEDGTWTFREFPSDFPPERRRTVHISTIPQKYGCDMGLVWSRVDSILRAREDRKGVIHTISYSRAKDLAQVSEFADRMLLNSGSRDLGEVVEIFKRSDPGDGMVLVSPSVDQGYDFPGDECRFQVILKLPFLSRQDPIVKRRCAVDGTYEIQHIATTLTQMAGRGVRSKDDWCETFIVDDQSAWFVGRNSKWFPKYFLQAWKAKVNLGDVEVMDFDSPLELELELEWNVEDEDEDEDEEI